ncbi:YhdP family protein [Caenimonas terrae]|uniref:YhdP family protein n=1 Tax=Caenimonas terrae TaxID=696074 RepID=A0ABW0NCJ5_9BURK
MNESTPSPSRLLKASASIAQWILWLLAAAWLLLALTWGALHGWIVPRIGELRPDLEIEASRVLGVPVRIGGISAKSEGLIPSFEFTDVVLLDAQGREAVRLPHVLAALTPESLWNLGFEQLVIDRPEVDIRRSADGRIHVAGLDFSKAGSGDGRAADWFFGQTEVLVRQGTVRWTDDMRAAPPLALRDVDFTLRNSTRRHAIRLDATPPPDWGDRFSLRGQFRQPLLARRAAWQEWDGQLFADFARVDVSQLRRYASLGVEVTQGRGALRAWVDVAKGRLVGATADIVLADVEATLGRNLTPLALRSASGRLGGKRREGGFEFQTTGLQFETREGQRWPGGNVFVGWTQEQGSAPAQGELRADKLDLDALSQIASRLPLGPVTHARIQAYAPKGMVDAVQASWVGPLDAPLKYQAKGRASRLELASQPGVARTPVPNRPPVGTPGVRGAAVDFDLNQAGGKARLAILRGALDFPGVFEEPVILLDELAADLQWRLKGEDISVSVANLKFANADAQGEGQGSWHTSDPARVATRSRFPGVLDLQASMSRADGTRVYRYLPQTIAKPTRDYVRESVTVGTASAVKFRIKGDLHDFPFSEGRAGEFRVSADVRNATYAYVPASRAHPGGSWPALTQLAGELVFDRNSMQIKGAQGRFTGSAGLQFKAEAQIPDLKASTVLVKGEVHGPLAESLAIVNGSPVSPLMGNALAKASTNGNADVRLQLELPIAHIDKSRVKGSVTLAGNDVQISPETPMLARARGVVNFSEAGFNIAGVQARALGGDLRLDGGSQSLAAGSNEPSLSLRVQGTASADGLRQARELGFLSRLARDTSGSAAYNAVLALRRGVFEIGVTSTLQGLATSLPPPLNKSAEQVLPLRFENSLLRDSLGTNPPRLQDQLTLDLGRVLSIAYVRDLSGAEPRVIRGAIGAGLAAGEAAPMPEQGVAANINLANVDVDAWSRVLEAAAGPGAPSLRPGAGGAAASLGYLPTVLAVRARELTMEGRKLHNVVVGGSRDGTVWRANVDAAELNGYVEYRQPTASSGGLVAARLARLNIAAAAASEVEALLEEQPTNVPALDIVVDDFELRGKKLGKLEVDAVNRVAAQGVREWRLNKLNLTMPEAAFMANGNWVALNAQAPAARAGARPADRRRMVMNFRFDIADSGQLLARFGMKDVVRRGKGRMEGQVAWVGSPLSLDYPSMNGAFNVNMEAGQFLKADPGLAKLLGVLSLQSLPRRLTLDFRDVFTEGFAFDFVRGDITIQQGLAATNNLQMKGVNAAVLMEGRADLAQETQDLKVVVIPEINAGTASLVATVINPAIGLGTFLAQMFLRQPLIRANTQEFHINGTWADPKIAKVPHTIAPVELRTGASQQSTSGASN